jgi:hypothetical protein
MLEYYRFEPFLRKVCKLFSCILLPFLSCCSGLKAVQDYVGIEHHDYVHDVDKGTR